MREEGRGNGTYRYLTDDELEALIAEVEDHGMLAPPAYLKDLIMEEAAKPVKSAAPAGNIRKKKIDQKAAKIQLAVYSLKIVGAAAAAIYCLTMVPMDVGRNTGDAGNRKMEKEIEEDVARYREESERILKEPVVQEDSIGSFFGNVFGMLGNGREEDASSLWTGITEWFGNGGVEE